MPVTASPITDILRSRYSVRKFLPTPLSPSDIRGVLEDAQAAPSNCNTQPWTVHVVSGAARDALSKELLKADEEERFSYDFSFSYADFGEGTYLDRRTTTPPPSTRLWGYPARTRRPGTRLPARTWNSTAPPTPPSSSCQHSATGCERPATSACTHRTSSSR
ncbi:nitroreductase family protein [Streptomyces scopuliridis]|uniref:nitroreductase family protein n=1 Tax=Streptomyces scopuliridis TaxID=452529 RepID=UPI002DDB3906|nr:nitroreductase family protein [Streptomyces scopuliridis]WSB31448.1 nitroreductase family protein [Streptomyces scopuliridis]